MSHGEVEVQPSIDMKNEEMQTDTLKISKNSDIAIRLVSPGLPPLNEEMKSTIELSQKIEKQQRNLIAAMNSSSGAGTPKSNRSSSPGGQASETVVVSTTKNTLPDEMDKLATPLSLKRLKRNNVPHPLRMTGDAAALPIQSAPIRKPSAPFTPNVARKRYEPYQIHVQHRGGAPRNYPPSRRYMYMAPSFTPGAAPHPHYKFSHVIPYTSSNAYFPPGVRSGFATHHAASAHPPSATFGQMPSAQRQSPKYSTVTDVYHGDYVAVAPLASQPLTAQREFFDSPKSGAPGDDHSSPRKNESTSPNNKDDNDVESNAIDIEEEAYGSDRTQEVKVFGSINLNGDSEFNFKIFHPSSSSTDSSPNGDRVLSREKEKFLKICETSWDEYVNSKK
ncbi:Piso0_001268 [Millerozyma farinosa CBS 7064]|uniref:Piso0_001268 protein n=1 Tax=Pichia sorbitophila (strain ATCC MYA-4447 / BCRC 22081 / CBS 7064 / NBRC 10061 / NRRL Y-12695) TaxID=559304 RepID=G8YMP9_PICSO|nr:Piso0_001268 [Millerozyma farinosa CBS 7064]